MKGGREITRERECEGETVRGGFVKLMRERWKEERDIKRRKCGRKSGEERGRWTSDAGWFLGQGDGG